MVCSLGNRRRVQDSAAARAGESRCRRAAYAIMGSEITVHHLPPGTGKWNKIEHRLFSFISMNWRAKPLVSYRVIVDLISATTTDTGLKVCCELDTNLYPKGIVVSDEEMALLNTVSAPNSMASGTTRSDQATAQIEQLIPDGP